MQQDHQDGQLGVDIHRGVRAHPGNAVVKVLALV
jgi:hypothetical protein